VDEYFPVREDCCEVSLDKVEFEMRQKEDCVFEQWMKLEFVKERDVEDEVYRVGVEIDGDVDVFKLGFNRSKKQDEIIDELGSNDIVGRKPLM